MNIRHLILMLLKASGDKIVGKTMIQKQIYFLSLLLNENIGFKPHYYGPYSPEIEQALDELIGAGFVSMARNIFGVDTNTGFEFKRYDFELVENGKNLAEIVKEENAQTYKKVEEFVKKMEVNKANYLSLSIAAKAYFILHKESMLMNKDAIREKAKLFGWNVTDADIDNAIFILRQLNLIEQR
ncbi:MAG: hypothetical protein MUO91_05705 [candidate division Zixibacteria bacterium]|nr:hypothetical protein [candidate division Zixibacteria bacterium]